MTHLQNDNRAGDGGFSIFEKCLSLARGRCSVTGNGRHHTDVRHSRVPADEESTVSNTIEIPPALYGRSGARTVPAEQRMRVEFRLRASTVQRLTIMSNESGTPVTRILERLIDSALRQE